MASIAPKYSIGIEEMDVQHARWIELVERFHATAGDHIRSQEGLDAARRALEELLEYTKQHFASEERFIGAHGYPDLQAHKELHRKLEAEVLRLYDEIKAHKTQTTPLKLNLFVTIWLMEHIMTEDAKYARFIRDKLKPTRK